LKEGERR